MKVTLIVSMSSSCCSVSNRFLNSIWNSIFFDTTRWPLGHHFPFHLYVQFDAHRHSVVTFSVDFLDDCYVCDDGSPVCSGVAKFGLRYTIWDFLCLTPPCLLLKHGILDLVLS